MREAPSVSQFPERNTRLDARMAVTETSHSPFSNPVK